MTIRRTLIGLFLLLGLGLCVSVALQALSAVHELREARELTRSNQARELLARAAVAAAEERTEAYLALVGEPAGDATADELRQATDQALQETATALRLVGGERSAAALEPPREALDSLRTAVEAARAGPEGELREAAAAEIIEGYSQVVDSLISVRIALLTQEHPVDPATAAGLLPVSWTAS